MTHQTVNYIRVSTVEQNPARQQEALPQADKVFLDRVSGSTTKRPQLQAMLDHVREGDRVFVYSIDRLARNIEDLNKLVRLIIDKGATVSFIREGLTFGNGNNAMNDLLLNVMGAFAQFERAMIRERQAEGIAAAQAAGKHMGRPAKFTDEQKAEIRRKKGDGVPVTELAREYSCSRTYIYKVLNEKA